MKLTILTLAILLVAYSCSLNKESLTKKIIGKWAIEKIEYNHKDYKSYLYSNVLIFDESYSVSIPETVHFIEDKNSSWKILNNKKLVITTSNLAFKDTFDINFINRNEDKPIGLEIKSDSIYIQAFNLFDLGK